MLKLDRSPSHSWWWDSHNSPRHSKWLQSNLQELDEKVKEMLQLIQEDADSFAQRAEMYYKKRPELVNLVEEFYRAYRSLAERYDHLTGEIRQNIPKALQVQYGLSCDSPRGPGLLGGRHRYSPLRKSTQLFEGIPKKSMNEQTRKGRNGSLSPPSEESEFYSGPKTPDRESIELSDKDNSQSSDLSSSDSEVDNVTPLNKLQQEIENLEKQNKLLTESHKTAIECNATLQQRIKALEGECECSTRESDELREKVEELNKSLILLQMENATMKQVDDLLASNLLLQMEKVTRQQVDDLLAPPSKPLPMLEDEIDCSMNEEDDDDCSEKDDASEGANGDYYQNLFKLCSSQDPSSSFLVRSMQAQISVLLEENKRQKLDIIKRGEEKREAIRQLCFTIDVMKSKNERLEMMLGQLKKRLCSASGNSAPQLLVPAWKRFFMGEWRNSKNFIQPQPFAVAL